jgi:hypothetical protein
MIARAAGSIFLLGCALVACDPGSSQAHGGPSATATASATVDPAALASSATPAKEPACEDETLADVDVEPTTLAEQRAEMIRRMRLAGAIDEATGDRILGILGRFKMAGQGNPEANEHPMTRAECIARRRAAGACEAAKPRCGAPFMAPIWDPAVETEADAKVCIDRYEFPNLPCEYPATWITTSAAEDICKAMGKRLCDAHEWEGACAGAVHKPEDEYAWGQPRDAMRNQHNGHREIVWAYGPKKDHTVCGTGSKKSAACNHPGFKECGSNTFPAGSFPACRSRFGVYDQHGNAAEQMALPLRRSELGSLGGFGEPEMKGSWFIFQKYEAHVDDCRWRAPSWHEEDGKNHANYHLGFRCCKDLTP